MVELNEKAGPGEQRTICEACGSSNLAHERAVWTDDGASFCPDCAALSAPDDGLVKKLVRQLNARAAGTTLRTYSDRMAIEDQNAATALQSQAALIERLTRERVVDLENYTRAWNEKDAQRRRAEQHIQKLTAENEKMREALAFYADPKNYKGAFVPGGRSERGTYVLEHHINLVRKDAGTIARSALGTQDDQK